MTKLHQNTRRGVLQALAGGVAGGLVLSGTAAGHKGGLSGELAEVRSATAEYNDPANAIDDDYVPEEHAVCGMGYHWGNFGLLGTVDRTVPQILVYGEDDDGNLILGAIEYAVPKYGEYSTSPPDYFAHDGGDEQWGTLGVPPSAPVPFEELWTLHVWVHTHNPEGVFSHHNPRKQFCPTTEE